MSRKSRASFIWHPDAMGFSVLLTEMSFSTGTPDTTNNIEIECSIADMRLENIGQVIAERQLEVENSPSTKVLVRMGKPQPFPEGTSYFCPYQITAFGKERIFYAGGVDAFQAIELCLKMIAIDLAALSRNNGQRFRWGADDEGGWGFPFPEVFKD